MQRTWILLGIVVIGALTAGFTVIRTQEVETRTQNITTFEECAHAGYQVMESYPAQCRIPTGELFVQDIDDVTIEAPAPVPTETYGDFDAHVKLQINTKILFPDGLEITLQEIQDSRCKPGVQCIWAGELSASFFITGGDFGTNPQVVQLGTTQNQSATQNEYRFTLKEATSAEATLVVSKNSNVPTTTRELGYITGHVTIGPFCPVEQADRPCTVPTEAYTSRNVIVYQSDAISVVARVALDSRENYSRALTPGTYWVQIQPAGIGEGEKKQVTVVSHETRTIDFDIDTGIR